MNLKFIHNANKEKEADDVVLRWEKEQVEDEMGIGQIG